MRLRARIFFLISIIAALAMLIGGLTADRGWAGPSIISRASLRTDGIEGNADSWVPSVSASGRFVAFQSNATNLAGGYMLDTNNVTDIFLRDTETGVTTRISTSAEGVEANDVSMYPSISDDGRYVAFFSWATNLVDVDTNSTVDVFIKDTLTGAVSRVSEGSGGVQANSASLYPSISGNGRYVAFESVASNIMPGDDNNKKDIFVKDTQTGGLILVSSSSAHFEGDDESSWADINYDGSLVTFHSASSNLIDGDTNGAIDTFVKNTQNASISRVSTDETGSQVVMGGGLPRISGDGKYVVFQSESPELVYEDTNARSDMFVKNIQTGDIERASLNSASAESNGHSTEGSVSADGRFVVFLSDATNLVDDDTNMARDVFAKDMTTGVLTRMSSSLRGAQGLGSSLGGSVSGDGRYVAFQSYSPDFVDDDFNEHLDVFLAPIGRHYLFTWYDNLNARNWILMGNGSNAAMDAWYTLDLAGELQDLPAPQGGEPGQVPPGWTAYGAYGIMGGPVDAASATGQKGLVSQRILWAGNSLEEVLGTDTRRLHDTLYWSWYDQGSPGFGNWVLVSNPNGQTIYVEITIAGALRYSGSIEAGENVTPQFNGLIGGPVVVQAWTDQGKSAPAYVMASQRVLSNYGAAFNEVPGTPGPEVSDRYLWTWYDQLSPGFSDWILLANDNEYEIYCEITIEGGTVADGYIEAGGNIDMQFPGVMGGPVEARCWRDDTKDQAEAETFIASQRVVAGPSFEEAPGYPYDLLSSSYSWTWYDQQSAGAANWVLINNPNSIPVYYELYIDGDLMASGDLASGKTVTPAFPGLMAGPVEVEAWTDDTASTPAAIIASQRVMWSGHFNEVDGIPGEPVAPV